MNNTLTIMVGLPASGKDFFIKNNIAQFNVHSIVDGLDMILCRPSTHSGTEPPHCPDLMRPPGCIPNRRPVHP